MYSSYYANYPSYYEGYGAGAVSYTHLDVYKRQHYTISLHLVLL